MTDLSRRQLLGAAGALVLELHLSGCATPPTASTRSAARLPGAGTGDTGLPAVSSLEPNAFVAVSSDGSVTVGLPRSEMGQGVSTSLPMLVAEELDVDFAVVRFESVIAHPRYGDMSTGGSTSIRDHYLPLRSAGAVARHMLVEAAALTWAVPSAECTTALGEVVHPPTGQRLPYGDLVALAATLPVPPSVPLKSPGDFALIGTDVQRLDAPAKGDGSAQFGADIRLPGMRYAVLARPPALGATLLGHDPAPALAVPGVLAVVPLAGGVAVVADTTWAALQGRAALGTTWSASPHAALDSAALEADLRALSATPPLIARTEGTPLAALTAASARHSAQYYQPYLAHAAIEPMCSTAWVTPGSCQIWAPTQNPLALRTAAALQLGMLPRSVEVHTTLLGGGFGRRLVSGDFLEAALLSDAVGAPVQVHWTRADDLRCGYLRPHSIHRMIGGLDAAGNPSVLVGSIATPSIQDQLYGTLSGVDTAALNGLRNNPYAFPNLAVGFKKANAPVPICWHRSVYLAQNVFALECFVDELAHLAGRDPLQVRLDLTAAEPRLRAVLLLAAAQAGWGGALPPGRAHGIACAMNYDSYIANVAEISVSGASLTVHRIVAAVDCGRAVHPDGVEAQVQGGVAFALTSVLGNAMSVLGGAIQEASFRDYPIVRMSQMPEVETHLVPSGSAPGGVGELPVPAVAPAVLNGVFAATGVRLRRLPARAP